MPVAPAVMSFPHALAALLYESLLAFQMGGWGRWRRGGRRGEGLIGSINHADFVARNDTVVVDGSRAEARHGIAHRVNEAIASDRKANRRAAPDTRCWVRTQSDSWWAETLAWIAALSVAAV